MGRSPRPHLVNSLIAIPYIARSLLQSYALGALRLAEVSHPKTSMLIKLLLEAILGWRTTLVGFQARVYKFWALQPDLIQAYKHMRAGSKIWCPVRLQATLQECKSRKMDALALMQALSNCADALAVAHTTLCFGHEISRSME